MVTLNRPERRNALTLELLNELVAAIKVSSDQTSERVLILSGAGAAFCTGLDLKEAADPKKAHATAEMVANTLVALSQTRLITIAAVHGAAVAGGAGIMSACDFVVAAEKTKIGYPEVRRGLVAGLILTFLRRQVGERLIDTLEDYAPNLRDIIVDWSLFTPADIERRMAMTDGNIRHLDMVPSQLFAQRPLPSWANYRTPIGNLYLCGAGTHPGGEVTGAPGHNAAHMILKDID